MKEQIILGSLLGDAFISKLQGKRKTYRISWEHCQEQKDYAIWKADNCLNNYSIYERSRKDERTGNTYHSITISSRIDDYGNYRKLFYPSGIKEVSTEVLNMLTPLAIAVWFMDDGNLYYNGNNCHLTLSVNGFSEQSKINIINYFKEKYNINFKQHQKAIRVTSIKEVKKFEFYFSEFYHKSMMFKTLNFAKQKHNNTLTDEQKKYRNKKYR